jgi:hypothetical protein
MEAQYEAIVEDGASDYKLPEKPAIKDYVLHPIRFLCQSIIYKCYATSVASELLILLSFRSTESFFVKLVRYYG